MMKRSRSAMEFLLAFSQFFECADAAVRQDLRCLNGHRRTALQFGRLVFAGGDGESDGDAAADDERHRDPEQQ